jgi:hypothetical protein
MYNAIAFEAWAWKGWSGLSLGNVISSSEKVASGRAETNSWTTSRAVNALYWSIRYISEIWKKHRLFVGEFARVKLELDNRFASLGPIQRSWWDYIQEVLDFSPAKDPEIEHRWHILHPILEQMTLLTGFLVCYLDECKILPLQRLEAELMSHGGVRLTDRDFKWLNHSRMSSEYFLKEYNRHLDGLQSIGLRRRLTVGKSDLPNVGIDAVKTCFIELTEAIELFCPKYKTSEGTMPFAPDNSRRVLENGSIEYRWDNVFILTLDIIGSTNSPQTNALKDAIRDIFQRYASDQRLAYQPTGDDAWVACSEDPRVLLGAATAIGLAGGGLVTAGERLRGTRKGLSGGSVAVVELPDHSVIIRDVRIPNTLPAAFYILSGIDQGVPLPDQNRVLIIESRTFERASDILALKAEQSKKVKVEAKHFLGTCYVHELF